jgi:hypothetical protein
VDNLLYGVDIEIGWDNATLQYVSHNLYEPVETYSHGILHKPVLSVEDTENDDPAPYGFNVSLAAPGTNYWFSYVSESPAAAWNSSKNHGAYGVAFDISFKILKVPAAGSPNLVTTIQLCSVTPANESGDEIPVTLVNGTVTIVPAAGPHVKPPAPANLTVSPSSVVNSSLTPGESFTVNVNAQVDRLYAFTFSLGYNATILNATTVTGNPKFPPATIVKTKGQVKVSSSLVSPSPSINGSLSLASIEFNVLATGTSTLGLYNVALSWLNGTVVTPYPTHSISNGTFSNVKVVPPPTGKAKIFLNPASKTDTKLGDIFPWNVQIANATGMYDYRFKLSYNKNILLCLGAIVIPPNNNTNFDAEETVNNTVGFLSVMVQYYAPAAPINITGNETVVMITFMVKGHGQTPLTMSNADISNLAGGSLNPVVIGGNFTSGSRQVAIMAIKVTGESYDGITYMPAIPVKMYPGRILDISVVPMDNDSIGTTTTETFNVTLYANSTVIEVKPVTLSAQTNTTLMFSWNTTGLIPGENFTLWAQASTVPGQTNTAHNILYDGSVFIKMLGDVNGDGVINIADVTAIAATYGTHWHESNFNPEADIAPPYGLINILDIVTCTRYYKVTY